MDPDNCEYFYIDIIHNHSMEQAVSIGEYSILEYPPERGVTIWPDPKAQQLSDALSDRERIMTERLERESKNSFGDDTVSFGSSTPGRPLTNDQQRMLNIQKFNDLFSDDIMYGNIQDFEKQVLKNDYPEKLNYMNGKGYWEAVLVNFVTEGMKPKYGFGPEAGKYQGEFMETPLGKGIESGLQAYYRQVRLNKQKNDKQLFHNAVKQMVEGIPKFWEKKARERGTLDLRRGGSKKRTTRKYKNRKLSYKRNNKKRTTKNRRRYSRRK